MHFQCPTNDCESGPEAQFRKMREGGNELMTHEKLGDKFLVRSDKLRNGLRKIHKFLTRSAPIDLQVGGLLPFCNQG
jgi:hypothetical protein